MAELSGAERGAIAAVARWCSGDWEEGQGPAVAHLTVDGRRIGVDVAIIGRRGPGRTGARARFRDDKVARRVLRDLESAVNAQAPGGRTVIVTLGAPIKVANQMLAQLTQILVTGLKSGTPDVEERLEILGNRVRYRVLGDGSAWTSRAVGFVFSGDPSCGELAEAMVGLRDVIAAKATCAPAGERWLVLAGGDWIADIKTYRRAFSYLAIPGGFEKVLMVFGGGRVEAVVG